MEYQLRKPVMKLRRELPVLAINRKLWSSGKNKSSKKTLTATENQSRPRRQQRRMCAKPNASTARLVKV